MHTGAARAPFRHHTISARQPPITWASLGAREANQRVDLNALNTQPPDRTWKHIPGANIIRMDNVYDNVPGALAASDLTDAKGARRHDFCASADITMATSVAASRVPIWLVLQDQVLLLAWACKNICEDQVDTLRRLPGLKNLVRGNRRRAKDERIAHMTEDVTRWAALQAVLV